ncbi:MULTISPECIES: DUF1707 SHOCT-like domain-containing protein [Nonomuraea]|uniref:DUF1707 domain-containing protein n=1 Tax=Nonomuraea mangrovi TaxID=2316207 RepID=A0ABW4SSI1_9ACTN
MRASDVDRDRVAAVLREHTAQGRISVEEFNERLEQVYQSKTYGELARVTADLPDVDLRAQPARVPAAKSPQQGMHPGMRGAWAAWASAVAVTSVIWLLTDFGGYFWPMWVAGPWGALLLVSSIFGTNRK